MSELLQTLESETCSRCGGSGNYSRCEWYGTTCFRCRGRKVTYTKRGEQALRFLNGLRSKPAREFAVGDLFWLEGVPGFTKSAFHKVTAIKVHSAAEKVAKGHRSLTNGIEVPQRDTLILEAEKTSYECDPDTVIRKGCTAEEKAATMAQALEYQATLGKNGKPLKRLPSRMLPFAPGA
jgi:hypothetical protein